ncbi:MAG: hypothetical protein ACRD1Y_04360 [Terriglobales bacterium]
MRNHSARYFRGIIDRTADAITLAWMRIAGWIYGPYPETEVGRLRAAQLRRMVEEGRAIGLLDEGRTK